MKTSAANVQLHHGVEGFPATDDRADDDYEGLAPEIVETVKAAKAGFRLSFRAVQSSYIEAGVHLLTIKQALGHGNFKKWLDREVPSYSLRTIERWMRAGEVFGTKIDIMSNLTQPTVNALAAPSFPPELRESIVEQLESANPPTEKALQGRIQEVKKAKKSAKAGAVSKGSEYVDAVAVLEADVDPMSHNALAAIVGGLTPTQAAALLAAVNGDDPKAFQSLVAHLELAAGAKPDGPADNRPNSVQEPNAIPATGAAGNEIGAAVNTDNLACSENRSLHAENFCADAMDDADIGAGVNGTNEAKPARSRRGIGEVIGCAASGGECARGHKAIAIGAESTSNCDEGDADVAATGIEGTGYRDSHAEAATPKDDLAATDNKDKGCPVSTETEHCRAEPAINQEDATHLSATTHRVVTRPLERGNYALLHDGKVIVPRCRSPERRACVELSRMGYTGRLDIVDEKTDMVRMQIPEIGAYAKRVLAGKQRSNTASTT